MKWVTGGIVAAVLLVGFLVGELVLWVFGGAILIVALWAWYLHDANSPSQRSQGLAAALSAIALLFGVYWYIIERPGAAKLDLILSGHGFRMEGRRTLVFLAVEVRNVGNTPVSFEAERGGDTDVVATPEEPAEPPPDVDCRPEAPAPFGAQPAKNTMKVRLGKVAPVAPDLLPYLDCASYSAKAGQPAMIARADLWPPVGRVDQALVTKIEAGESEKYYYRFVMPCERGLVLSATAQIPKRATFTDTLVRKEPEGQVWIAQTLLDLTPACGK